MRVKLQFIATAISVLAIVAGIVCKRMMPQWWTDWLAAAIGLLWLAEMVLSFVLEHAASHHEATAKGRFTRIYLIAKGVKLMLTLGFIIVGVMQIGSEHSIQATVFACAAVVLYLLHLAGETSVVTRHIRQEGKKA